MSQPSDRPATAGQPCAGRVDHQPSVMESPCTTQRGAVGAGAIGPPIPRTPRITGDWASGGWTVNGPRPPLIATRTTASAAGSVKTSVSMPCRFHSAKPCARSRSASVGPGTVAR